MSYPNKFEKVIEINDNIYGLKNIFKTIWYMDNRKLVIDSNPSSLARMFLKIEPETKPDNYLGNSSIWFDQVKSDSII